MTVLAIVPGLVGALGGHLAAEGLQEEKRRFWIKLIFWAMCAVWVLATFWQQFRVAEADLDRATKDGWANALLSTKFPPPPAPIISAPARVEPKAKIEFVFYNKGSLEGAPAKEISLPVLNGGISLMFSARVVGGVIPKDGALWIKICDQCSFAGEMPGFLSDKDDPHLRSVPFRLLYLGTVLPRMTANINLPAGALDAPVPVYFYYACVNCDPLDATKPQAKLSVREVYSSGQ